MNTMQTTYTTLKTNTEFLFNDFINYVTPFVQDAMINFNGAVEKTVDTTKSLPYELWVSDTITFLDANLFNILFITSFIIVILFNYVAYCNQQKIITNQKDMINQLADTESMELFKLRSRVTKLEQENEKKTKIIESMKNTVELYRSLRHSKAGFFLLKGDPSSREFRNKMKDLGSDKRYVSNKEYLVKLKHLSKFDNQNVTI